MWPCFVFRTFLTLRGIDSTRCWKHPPESLLHTDMIASNCCCRFVSWASIVVPAHSKWALRDRVLMTVEAICAQWTHCHIQETRWSEICDPRNHHQQHYNTSTSLNHWMKAGWIHVFVYVKSFTLFWILQQKHQIRWHFSNLLLNCSLSLLFLAVKSGTWYHLLLLYPICFRFNVLCDMLLWIPW